MKRKELLRFIVPAALIAVIVYLVYKQTQEGFAASTVTISAKLNARGQVSVKSFTPSLISPSGSVTGGVKSISIAGMSPTLGSLSNIAVQYKKGSAFVAPPAAKVDTGGTSLRFERANGPLRLGAARLAAADKTPKLPKTVSELGNSMKILNIEVGNLQGIDLAAPENVRFVLNFV